MSLLYLFRRHKCSKKFKYKVAKQIYWTIQSLQDFHYINLANQAHNIRRAIFHLELIKLKIFVDKQGPSKPCGTDFAAFGLSVINCGNDCSKTKEVRLIHLISTPSHLYPFYFLVFSHTYLIALSCFTSLYKHLFIYLSCVHSDEELQTKTSVLKFFFTTV